MVNVKKCLRPQVGIVFSQNHISHPPTHTTGPFGLSKAKYLRNHLLEHNKIRNLSLDDQAVFLLVAPEVYLQPWANEQHGRRGNPGQATLQDTLNDFKNAYDNHLEKQPI